MEDYKAQYYNDALLHYGVKGMKWGVRRKAAMAVGKVKRLTADARLKRVDRKISRLKKKRENQRQKVINRYAKAHRIAAAVKKSAKTYGNFQKERLTAFGNMATHPIISSRALSNNMKNDKLRTKLRKQLYLTGNEYKSINRDVRRQKLANKKRKKRR